MSETDDDIEDDVSSAPIFRVLPENVTPLWPQLLTLFKPALAMVSTHKAEDVRRAIMASRAQLWAQISGDTVLGAATTEFIEYPVGIYVRVWLAGARGGERFDDQGFFEVMNRWREQNGCVGFEAIGRHGWLRRFPRAKVEGLVLRYAP
jgi:hypothetical protein